jgi:xanthine/uracil/vitamin C permease (AzgA family)
MSVSESEIDERAFGMIGGGSALMHVVTFTAVGALALETFPYGAVVGVFAGVGTYLFLPWFLHVQAILAETDEQLAFSEAARRTDRSSQLGALGLGLELGSIAMLAVGFALAEVDYVVGISAGFLVAAIVYLVASFVLDW